MLENVNDCRILQHPELFQAGAMDFQNRSYYQYEAANIAVWKKSNSQ